MTTIIEVTNEHIARGRPCYCTECPVALAILEVVAPGVGVVVSPNEITLIYNIGLVHIITPYVAMEFINAYDREEDNDDNPRPIKFLLDIPDRYLRHDGTHCTGCWPDGRGGAHQQGTIEHPRGEGRAGR